MPEIGCCYLGETHGETHIKYWHTAVIDIYISLVAQNQTGFVRRTTEAPKEPRFHEKLKTRRVMSKNGRIFDANDESRFANAAICSIHLRLVRLRVDLPPRPKYEYEFDFNKFPFQNRRKYKKKVGMNS